MKKTMIASGALALGLLAAGSAWAQVHGKDQDQPDNKAIAMAKVSLGDAVLAAERSAGGRAYEAGIEEEHGRMFFEVDVATTAGAKEVKVDAQTGKVVQTAATSEGSEEDGDDE